MTHTSRAALAALLAMMTGSRVSAQDVSLAATAIHASHELLGNPLVGLSLGLGLGSGSPLRLGVNVEGAGATSRRSGVVCAGLVRPGTCVTPETIRDEARIAGVTGSFSARLAGTERRHVALGVGVQVEQLKVTSTGTRTGDTLSADNVMVGAELAGELAWSFSPRSPLGLFVTASTGYLRPGTDETVVDGYTPLNGGFGVRRLGAGVRLVP